jgi:hypothetical protein
MGCSHDNQNDQQARGTPAKSLLTNKQTPLPSTPGDFLLHADLKINFLKNKEHEHYLIQTT